MDTQSSNQTPKKRKRAEDTITNKATKYFAKIPETDFLEDSGKTHVCNVCNTKVNGSKEWNLAQHLQKCHLNIYEELNGQKDTPKIKRLKFLQNCVEIVSVNGRPFACLLDSGFHNMVKDKLSEFNKAGCPINLSHANLVEVKDHLQKTAEQIRDEIKKETQNRSLSLLVDIVTRQRRSICGFSVQYVLNGELKTRSIGMVELLYSHTGKYIANVIISRLKEFCIELRQIVTITTDNGSNVLKMVRDINDHLQSENDNASRLTSNDSTKSNDQIESNGHEKANEDTDALIEELLRNEPEVSDDEAYEMLFAEVEIDQNYSTLLNEMTTEISSSDIWDITGVNCAEHTLQLGINDSIKKMNKSFQNVIELCRCVCKFLRLKSTCVTLDTIGMDYIIPRLANATRWGSMFLMVRFIVHTQHIVSICLF